MLFIYLSCPATSNQLSSYLRGKLSNFCIFVQRIKLLFLLLLLLLKEQEVGGVRDLRGGGRGEERARSESSKRVGSAGA